MGEAAAAAASAAAEVANLSSRLDQVEDSLGGRVSGLEGWREELEVLALFL